MAVVTSTFADLPALRSSEGGLASLIRMRSSELGPRTFVEHARNRRKMSFRALEEASVQWLAEFEDAGIAPGSTVALAMTDPVEFAAAYLAIIASGRWVAPVDPTSPVQGPGGLAAALGRVQANIVLSDRQRPVGVDVAWRVFPNDSFGDRGATTTRLPSLGSEGGAVLASSGTTGAPKVVRLEQAQLLHTARSVQEHHQLTTDDRGFNSLPLFHINAEVVGLLSALVAGSSLVLDDAFHRTDFWDLMAQRSITWVNAVPAIVSRLSELRPGESVPTSIRFIRSASAPLPAATLRTFEANIGIPVLETYGMTEAASQITANPLDGVRKPGSVGLPVGVEVRVVPDAAASEEVDTGAATGGVGHVEIRGPSVIGSYGGGLHGDRFDPEGWLRTGDLGHFDSDGYLYLDARTDDVINRGGEKVFPREIEELIVADPGVAAVCVVAGDDPVFGQVPIAYVVVSGDDAADVVGRVRDHLEATLVRSKRPASIRVISSLPTGATGKVQRRALRDGAEGVLFDLDCR